MKIMNTIKRLCAAALVLAAAWSCSDEPQGPIRVACVGDSVTYGMRIEERESNCYPARLQRMLGEGYDVRNFGHSGTTLLRHGYQPYVECDEYREAVEFAADIVVIHLGLNDTDPRNWPEYSDEFIDDYLDLIADFRRANPRCKIYICRMSPIFHDHRRFETGARDWYREIQPKIEEVARREGLPLIDLQEPLYHRPDLLPDALHPNAEGAQILAQTVYSAITGDYGGLRMSGIYSDNMVLQSGCPLRIAGTADAGEKVTVRLGRQKRRTAASPDGRWEVTLDPLKPSFEPMTLTVSTRSRTLEFDNVVAGEVWLCSGQSNMVFQLGRTEDDECREQLAYAAGADALRLCDMAPCCLTEHIVWEHPDLDSVNCLKYYLPAEWKPCTPDRAADFSAVAFAFGRMLADSLKCPVGLIHNAVGGSPTEAWVSRRLLEKQMSDIMRNLDDNELIQDWCRRQRHINISGADNAGQRHPYDPCYLFEAGILPLSDVTIKGVIWYQGESNAHNVEAHEELFTMLVDSWREVFRNDSLPFHVVQLSSINRPTWPEFRDSQRRLAERTEYCDIAVSSDAGHVWDVHPRRKRVVGERLARLALRNDYGFDITASGPYCLSAVCDGSDAVLSFACGENMHGADGEALRTFELSSGDGKWFAAEAVVEGDGVIRLHAAGVERPHAVRYGWQPYTTANLVNGDDLPASTFCAEVSEQ